MIESASFSEIEPEFMERIQRMVWCNLATLNMQNRIRSRVIHPIWEGPTGWLTTRRDSHKGKHLAHHPYISLAYIADVAKPVYVDCLAEWADDMETKARVWDIFKNTPPPLGYDPATIFNTIEHPNYGVLKFIPWRMEIANPPGKSQIWRNEF